MLRRLLTRLQGLLWKTSWRLAERRNLQGFDVGISPAVDSQKEQLAFENIDAALTLIQLHDPRRFQRIRTDVQRIHAFGTQAQYLGRWVDALRTCQLATDWIVRPDTRPADIASTIVHEATHARLSRFTYDEPKRQRIEQICHKQEEAFALRLPDAMELVEQARRAQQRAPEFYSNTSLKRQSIDALRSLGVPTWVIRALHLVFKTGAA